ncbi:MAG: PEP-CTERM sorting domain-containing protein [Deltaproteobacteria bacterium]|nr:PEP-CTERM sorting domain-containing protein [Deltaproteobacteria bacterium]
MRAIVSILVGSMIFLSASLSSALAFTFTGATVSSGRPLNALFPGDEVTIGIRMSNPSGATIFGVGAGIQGWDNSILTFVSAEMNPGPYFCTTASCGAGLENALSLPADPVTGNFIAGSSDVQSFPGVGNYVPLVQAIATTGRSGNGARDPGLDGVVNGGDAQFRIVFRIGSAGGATTITIGTNANPTLGNVVVLAGGQTEPAQNAFVTRFGDGLVLTQVPEPGTALLVGLGLTILAARSRRSA